MDIPWRFKKENLLFRGKVGGVSKYVDFESKAMFYILDTNVDYIFDPDVEFSPLRFVQMCYYIIHNNEIVKARFGGPETLIDSYFGHNPV